MIMFEIRSVHEINASPADVWRVLIDFEAYTEWNPFIINAKINEDNLTITTHPPGDKARSFSPILTKFIANRELKWVGKVGSECILRAEHSFELEEITPDRTRLVQSEIFSGALTCIMGEQQRLNIQRGFEAMNTALSERVDEQNRLSLHH